MTLPQARRIALAAQGFGRPRPATVGMRQVQRVIDQVAQFQIDSINIVARAHYFPLFARLGPYEPGLLDRCYAKAPRRLFEYWGHAASLIDVRLEPALRTRMAAAQARRWPAVDAVRAAHPGLAERIVAELAERGPLRANDIEHAEDRRRDHWGWNWSEVKHVLEWLLSTGVVSSAGRTPSFERLYALRSDVLPAAVLAEETPDPVEANLQLTRRALSALGVADTRAVADYFRLRVDTTKRSLQTLVAAGEAERVTVPGWRDGWLATTAARPRRVHGQALISPFDSLVYERQRLETLFGLRYRIEIYTPAARREFGYYVYLFLCDEAIAARVDLKADRAAGVLRVLASWLEPGADAGDTAARLAGELRTLASWQALGDVAVEPRGDLHEHLARALS
ncbi:winged helix-turn-helix domain-containing protein [Nigerium massiliense]|uniref:winged helix-turn-helix domain-containing protein n=1 Tax=Nigerium massiliense TaxID=1522317 RepID=UPI001F1A2610|nr:crosslink repair DNA glycosylase YcaQ family protein [Nigerium massiliense]